MINLVYLSPNPYGGWVTFTAHLMYGFRYRGRLYKISKNTEKKTRKFGYGLQYRNVNLDDFVGQITKHRQITILTAVHKNFLEPAKRLLETGAWVVIHDPNEFHLLEYIPDRSRIITIRKSVQNHIPESLLIPHPYRRTYPRGTRSTQQFKAVSVARIDFDKNTDIILGANRLLDEEDKIRIYGFENRLYGKFKLMKQFPEWEQVQSTHKFPREDGFACKICHEARFAVDLSVIQDDGGGTQYTFLEAMDAGAINVLHDKWTAVPGEMKKGVNCLSVSSPEELVDVVANHPYHEDILYESGKILIRHDSSRVATILNDCILQRIKQ